MYIPDDAKSEVISHSEVVIEMTNESKYMES